MVHKLAGPCDLRSRGPRRPRRFSLQSQGSRPQFRHSGRQYQDFPRQLPCSRRQSCCPRRQSAGQRAQRIYIPLLLEGYRSRQAEETRGRGTVCRDNVNIGLGNSQVLSAAARIAAAASVFSVSSPSCAHIIIKFLCSSRLSCAMARLLSAIAMLFEKSSRLRWIIAMFRSASSTFHPAFFCESAARARLV